MSKTPDTQMPALNPNCETCPVFDRCSAVAGMKAVATLVTIVNNNEPLRPWAERTLEALRDDTNNVSEAIQSCEGATEVTHPGSLRRRVYSFINAPYGSEVSRRPVDRLNDPDAPETVKFKAPPGGARISDIETAISMRRMKPGPHYSLKYPDRYSIQSPFGSFVLGESHRPSFMNEGGVATREAARRICNSVITFDKASTRTKSRRTRTNGGRYAI